VRRGWIVVLVVGAVVVAALLVVWAPWGGDSTHKLTSARRGFSVTVPSGWKVDERKDDPQSLFVAWNGDHSAPNSDPIDCGDERRQFKVRVWVMDAFADQEPNRLSGASFDERSGTGLVSGSDGYVCGERTQSIVWEENGRRVQAAVLVGQDGASQLDEAYGILNSLHVDPLG
jgi:hypothetical protein